jgi:hypothetical protein
VAIKHISNFQNFDEVLTEIMVLQGLQQIRSQFFTKLIEIVVPQDQNQISEIFLVLEREQMDLSYFLSSDFCKHFGETHL